TVALTVSPYTRRHYVDNTINNQTGMVKTIEPLLILPAINHLDLSATPLRGCFQLKPDMMPYDCVLNRVALDEMNPAIKKLSGKALHWAKQSLAMNLDEGDAAD